MPEAIAQRDPIEEIVTRMVSPAVTGITALPLHVDKIALAAVATAGGIFAWQNPTDQKVMAAVLVDVTTIAPATRTGEVGVAVNATTLSSTLMNAFALDVVALLNSEDQKGVAGRLFRKVDEKGGTSPYITGSSTGAAAITGLVGFAYVLWFPIA